MVQKIFEEVPLEVLQHDLEKYRQRALELGAADARIITTDMILIDERVRGKCHFPRCGSFGTSAHCPPHAMDLDQVRKIVKKFQYALFTMFKVPSEEMIGREAISKGLIARGQMKNFEIIAKIEAEAFYDGYYLAMGFAGGPCKRAFCPDKECSALVPGKSCHHQGKARSAMEAVGMDAYLMAAKAGWEIYPVGASSIPSEVPHGTRLGLVLIY